MSDKETKPEKQPPLESLTDDQLREYARRLLRRVKHLQPFNMVDDPDLVEAHEYLKKEVNPVEAAQNSIEEKEKEETLPVGRHGKRIVTSKTLRGDDKPMEFDAQFDLLEGEAKRGSSNRNELLEAIKVLEKLE